MSDKGKGDLLMKAGYEYLNGTNGRPKDRVRARQQFIKAVEYNSKAAVSLSVNFNQNQYVEKLAQAGDAIAMAHLVICYTYGNYGYTRNFGQAELWARRHDDAQPQGSEAMMHRVQSERQRVQQALAREEANRRYNEERRLARLRDERARELKAEQKRLEKQIQASEERMRRDQQQAEADAAAERSAARWRDTVSAIQSTGDQIVSDLRHTQHQTNRAIYHARQQQEEINQRKRQEFERKKRELEEKQARQRAQYEAEQKQIEARRRASEQDARRRAELESQRREQSRTQANEQTTIKILPPAVTDAQVTAESPRNSSTLDKQGKAYAGLSFALPSTPPSTPGAWNPDNCKRAECPKGESRLQTPESLRFKVPIETRARGERVITGSKMSDSPPTPAASTRVDPPPVNVAEMRKHSAITREPLFDTPQAGPWTLIFHTTAEDALASMRFWPVNGFKGISVRAICKREGHSSQVEITLKNGNNGRVYFGGQWRVDGTHGTVGLTMNITRFLEPGQDLNVSSQGVNNLKCKMDNMQVFVRGTRVSYDADGSKFVGPP